MGALTCGEQAEGFRAESCQAFPVTPSTHEQGFADHKGVEEKVTVKIAISTSASVEPSTLEKRRKSKTLWSWSTRKKLADSDCTGTVESSSKVGRGVHHGERHRLVLEVKTGSDNVRGFLDKSQASVSTGLVKTGHVKITKSWLASSTCKTKDATSVDARNVLSQSTDARGSVDSLHEAPSKKLICTARSTATEAAATAENAGSFVHSVSDGGLETSRSSAWEIYAMYKQGSSWSTSFSDEAVPEAKPPAESSSTVSDIEQSNPEVLVRCLQSGDKQAKQVASVAIRALARTSGEARVLLAQAGAIDPLVALLDSDDFAVLENAALAICNLAIGESRNKACMVKAGVVQHLVRLLSHETLAVREAAVAVVLTLAAGEEHKAAIGNAGSIPLITRVLNDGSQQGRADAAHALYNLLGCESNRAVVLRSEPVPGLLKVLQDSPDSRGAEKAVAVIYTLTAVEEGRLALFQSLGAVTSLMAVVEKGTAKGREVGIAALLAACNQSRKCCSQAVGLGAVPVLLALSQDAPLRLRAKIRSLLKCLEKPGSAPVVLLQPVPGLSAIGSPSSPLSPSSSSSSLSPGSSSSRGSFQALIDVQADFPFTSGNNIVREMVEESRRGAMKQLRLRARLPEL